MEGINWLATLQSEQAFFKAKEIPSLQDFSTLLTHLGDPDLAFEQRIIVGGTAGKGSVCRYIEQALINEGYKTTLISSPDLQIVEERIRVNGKLCSQSDLNEVLLEIQAAVKATDTDITYYEAVVLSGILIGSKQGGILIGEIGLGGEWDALNAVKGPRVAGLTFVGSDHLEILGPKLENVAETKAGIFNKYCIHGFSYDKNYCSIIDKKSNCKIQYIKGINKKLNKKLARKILEQILGSKSFDIPKLHLPARWEKVGEKVILEGAHSAPKLEYILPKIKKITGPKIALIAMMKNHDFKDLEILINEFDDIIWTTIPGKNSWDPAVLKEHFKKGAVIVDPDEALKTSQKKDLKIVVLGSFYLCGYLRDLFYPKEAMRAQLTEFPTKD